ncbi:hypothetical protein DYQ86_27545 [Acidobacteria bacterium AB60]|nr:hypothetical protein DYQ86_27545 [Acidobacteria bacterium AB60]
MVRAHSFRPFICGLLLGTLVLFTAGCGSSKTTSANPGAIFTVTLPAAPIVVAQDGAATHAQMSINSTNYIPRVTFTGLPAGVQAGYAATGDGPSGTLSFTASSATPPGTYPASATVAFDNQSETVAFTLVVAPVVKVANTVDTTLGVNGKLEEFLATSFQIFQYTGQIFGTGATSTARQQQLTNLGAQHNRLQVIAGGTPMVSNTGTAADWDFTIADTTVQPVLASGDHSPEFQIGTAPAWMCDSQGHLLVAAHANDFAAYAANLVRYYNKGGFNWGSKHFQSPASSPITWWGIFNEPNLNGLTAADYATLYNTTVPAMLAVDPTIKISALELSDFSLGSGGPGDPQRYVPAFLATTGGVAAPVDVLSTHLYGTCNQADTDATLFAQVPGFAQNIRYLASALATRPDLANTQIWVTENNVNADYPDAAGNSTCNPGKVFAADPRGSSAFFAAWRPFVFAQLGKAGNRALYHWQYAADNQYGEVDAASGTYLGYWVDRTLINAFASTPSSPSQDILSLAATDASEIETLATRASNGAVRVMVINRALHAASDNNGSGVPRTILIDSSAFGTFGSASLLTLDATTSATNGPTGAGVAPSPRIPVTLNGYGSAILTLTP